MVDSWSLLRTRPSRLNLFSRLGRPSHKTFKDREKDLGCLEKTSSSQKTSMILARSLQRSSHPLKNGHRLSFNPSRSYHDVRIRNAPDASNTNANNLVLVFKYPRPLVQTSGL